MTMADDDYENYEYERTIHTTDSDQSLRIPSTLPLQGYDMENWKFSELGPSSAPGAIFRLAAECKLFGWERLKKEWYFTEEDILQYGGGSPEKLREYVETSFALAMLHKKAQMIKKIHEAMKIATFKSNSIN